MFSETFAFYDLLYSSFKDYEAEARLIDHIIKSSSVDAKTVLDVACGTGEHARILSRQYGYHVDGVDVEPGFVRIAREKNPNGHYVQGDMLDFDTQRRYDVVLCLFSSIGYVKTLDGVTRALRNMRRHMTRSGLALVEPWITPENWHPGTIGMVTAETEDLKICRISHSDTVDACSRITLEYLIGRRDGIQRASETHDLGLFTTEEMLACFHAAGLSVVYDEPGLTGRGLYTARVTE